MSRVSGQSKGVSSPSLFERCVACAIACVLLLAGLGVPFRVAQARPYPGESARDTSWYNSGQSSFVLSTPEELAGLAYLVSEEQHTFEGKTVTLANDIDLSGICSGGVDWLPIGWGYSNGTPFMGTFDGGNHTISGLKIDDSGYYNALFGSIRKATIKNLTVQGQVYGSEYVAGIVSQCSDSDLINLTNECYVDTQKYGNGYSGRAGGVVCYVATAYPTKDSTFKNLVNKGDIKASCYYVGGVAGFLYCSDDYSISVIDCANYGNVDVSANANGNGDANRAAGGVIGSTAGNYGTYVVSGCVNEGSVSSANLAATGGVAGYLGGNGSSITYSSNTGVVSGPNAVGGIAGYFGSSGGTMQSTLNTGVVSGGNAGAIAGASSNSSQTYALNFTYDGAMSKAYGSGVGADGLSAAMSAEELQTQDFLDLINNGDSQFARLAEVNNGFPILAWTNPNAIPGKGGIVNADPSDPEDPSDSDQDAESPSSSQGDGEEGTDDQKAAEDAQKAAEEAEKAAEKAADDAEKEADDAKKDAKDAEEAAKQAAKDADDAENEAEKAKKAAEEVDDSDKKAKKAAEKAAEEAAEAAEKARKTAEKAAKEAEEAKKRADEKAAALIEAKKAVEAARKAAEEARKAVEAEKAKAKAEAEKKAKEKAEAEKRERERKEQESKKQRDSKWDNANQTKTGAQNGVGTGVKREDPEQYNRQESPAEDVSTPSALARLVPDDSNQSDIEQPSEPTSPEPSDSIVETGMAGPSIEPGDSASTDENAPAMPVAGDTTPPTTGGADDGDPSGQGGSGDAAAGGNESAEMADDTAGLQAYEEAAAELSGASGAQGSVARQMVEITEMPQQEQEIGGDEAPELVVFCAVLAVLLVISGAAWENIAFSRRVGGWRKQGLAA